MLTLDWIGQTMSPAKKTEIKRKERLDNYLELRTFVKFYKVYVETLTL